MQSTNSQKPDAQAPEIKTFVQALDTLQTIRRNIEAKLPEIELKTGYDCGLNRASAQLESVILWLESALAMDPAEKASQIILDWRAEKPEARRWIKWHDSTTRSTVITIVEVVNGSPVSHDIFISQYDLICLIPEPGGALPDIAAFCTAAIVQGIATLAGKVTDAATRPNPPSGAPCGK